MATANKNLSQYDKTQLPNAKDFRFGIVVSEWNDKITNGLYQGAYDTLIDCGAMPEKIIKWNVPGSFELINGAKKMIENKNGHSKQKLITVRQNTTPKCERFSVWDFCF